MKRALMSAVFAGVLTTWLYPSPAAAQDNSSGTVSIEVLIGGQPADSAPGPTVNVGDTLTLDYVITVGGSEELYDLAVRDTSGAKPSCDTNGDGQPDGFSVHPGPLTAGAIFTCTATVNAADADGTVAIIATVSAADFDGLDRFEAQDPAHYTPASPTTTTIPTTTSSVTTSAPPTTAMTTPPTTAASPVSAEDPEDTPSSLGFGDDGSENEQASAGDQHENELADDDRRPIETTATIEVQILLDTGHELRSPSGDGTGTLPPVPVVPAGTEADLAWSYVVTNTGDLPLDQIEVLVVEDVGGGDPRAQAVTCPWENTGSLPPGRAIRCFASTPAPLTPGPMTVSATVRAAPTGGEIDTDGGPVDDVAYFEVTIEGSDEVAFAEDTPLLLLFGFGIAFALLAAASSVLWLLSRKPDLDHELP